MERTILDRRLDLDRQRAAALDAVCAAAEKVLDLAGSVLQADALRLLHNELVKWDHLRNRDTIGEK